MMFKVGRVFLLLILLMSIFPKDYGYAAQTTERKAIIVYGNERIFGYNVNIVNHLEELLHAFNKEVETISLDTYKSGQLKSADSIFVLNVERVNHEGFLKELTSFQKKVYWIGEGIEQYLDYSKKYELEFKGLNNNIQSVTYKDRDYSIKGNYIFPVIQPKTATNILATMNDGYINHPFIIRDGNLFYISRWDLKENYIFEDTLWDFYNINNYPKSEIFVRIEDVHPFRNPKNLKKIADYLYEQNVPFMIALIPTYVDQKTGKINTMNDKPDFVEAIQYMQKKGGSVLMHGYTHQLGNREISGEGYEYWDMESDKPINEDIKQYVRDRLISGLRLCLENDVYPLGFEAPHYAMNEDGYMVLKQYVSTYVGQFQNNNESFTTSTFPYVIHNSKNFTTFIPENLGYVDSENPFAIEEIKEHYEKLSNVRGHTGGFFFHPYLDIQYLKDIIHFLKDRDVDFLDLKERENQIKIDDIFIQSKSGDISVQYDKEKTITEIKQPTSFDRTVGKVNRVVVFFVSAVLILFIIIFILFRTMTSNKYARRK